MQVPSSPYTSALHPPIITRVINEIRPSLFFFCCFLFGLCCLFCLFVFSPSFRFGTLFLMQQKVKTGEALQLTVPIALPLSC